MLVVRGRHRLRLQHLLQLQRVVGQLGIILIAVADQHHVVAAEVDEASS